MDHIENTGFPIIVRMEIRHVHQNHQTIKKAWPPF